MAGLKPDLVLLLDLDPKVGLERARRRGDVNRFEEETLDFMNRTRGAYLERAQADPTRYALIDAGQALEKVQAAIALALTDHFGLI